MSKFRIVKRTKHNAIKAFFGISNDCYIIQVERTTYAFNNKVEYWERFTLYDRIQYIPYIEKNRFNIQLEFYTLQDAINGLNDLIKAMKQIKIDEELEELEKNKTYYEISTN
jgi:hypothetical protein